MFLCEKCHPEKDYPNCFHPFGSHGRCEDCGKTGDCVDCKAYKTPAPPPKTAPEFAVLKEGDVFKALPGSKPLPVPPHKRPPHPYFEFIRKCAVLLDLQDTPAEALMVEDVSWHACFDDRMTPEQAVAAFKANSEQWKLVKERTSELLRSVGLKPSEK